MKSKRKGIGDILGERKRNFCKRKKTDKGGCKRRRTEGKK
jgi:hypothetical protein